MNVPSVVTPRDDPVAAIQEDGRGPHGEQKAWQPAGEVGEEAHGEECGDERVVPVPEPVDLTALGIGAHDRAHPLERLDQERPDVGAALPQCTDLLLETAPVPHERPQRGRQGGEAHEKESPIQVEQPRDRSDERDHVAEPGERRFRYDALDFADVTVDAGDDVAERGAGVEARRQTLEVAIQLQAHVEQDIR